MTSTAAPLQLEVPVTVASRTPLQNALRRFSRHRSARVGMAILGFLIFIAIFAPLLAPYDPIKPMTVTIGSMALRMACLKITTCSRKPLARAVRM